MNKLGANSTFIVDTKKNCLNIILAFKLFT
jgi:hypothetical protein